MKIKEYTVVYSNSLASLVRLVEEKIRDGWQPLGGVAASAENWAQAMVKYAEE